MLEWCSRHRQSEGGPPLAPTPAAGPLPHLEQLFGSQRHHERRATGRRAASPAAVLRGEDSIAALCRREGIAESLYYSWSKEFLEAGKRRLAGDTARAATTDEVKALRQEARSLKEVVAEQALELRLLKKSMIADGDGRE